MVASHDYRVTVQWTGDRGTGTSGYRDYGRDHLVLGAGKPTILGSSDPTFRGDRDRWNPEEMLVAALSQCHMLTYLHLAVQAGIVVLGYRDEASGEMVQDRVGDGGEFREVTLRPTVTISDPAHSDRAQELHHDVPELCFIARSVTFPVHHVPTIVYA